MTEKPPDIVERLRWLSSPDAERLSDYHRINLLVPIGHEAADEIERLRAMNCPYRNPDCPKCNPQESAHD